MSTFSRIVVLVVGLMSVFAAMTGAASATTWTNAGDTTFTATTGPGTLTAGLSALTCNGGTATGLAPRTEGGPQYDIAGNITFRPCTLSVLHPVVTCTYQWQSTGPPRTGVTDGNLPMNCDAQTTGCRFTGTVPASYLNATTTLRGVLNVRGTTGLTVASGCILSGTATLAPDPMSFTANQGSGGAMGFAFGPLLTQP